MAVMKCELQQNSYNMCFSFHVVELSYKHPSVVANRLWEVPGNSCFVSFLDGNCVPFHCVRVLLHTGYKHLLS